MEKEPNGKVSTHSEERQFYMTAEDGSMVRVPESKLEDWIKAQGQEDIQASRTDEELIMMALEEMGYKNNKLIIFATWRSQFGICRQNSERFGNRTSGVESRLCLCWTIYNSTWK